jgi:ketosteroid isomerase-like protein
MTEMFTKYFSRSVTVIALVAAVVTAAVSQQPSREKQLSELADAERAFAAFTVKEGFRDGFIKFFADDGIGFGPHPERTREKLMKLPPATGPRKVIFNWAPMIGDISEAGDLGYTTGPVLFTDLSENPKPPWHGTYFSVWQKQTDGSWKVVVDMGVDTPDAVAAIDTKFTALDEVRRSGKAMPASDDYLKLDWDFWSSIAKTNVIKAYRSRLDKRFRIHRKGMMTVVELKDVVPPVILQAKFDLIGGKIASSNDLAFTYGRYTTVNEPTGPDSGYYVHVWRRDGSGRWKLVVDVQNPLPRSGD